MPNLDGVELCLRIRQWRQTPIILLSAWGAGEGSIRGLNLGAESYLDHEKATEDLGKLGDSVIPVLKKHLKDNDPEVRQRILRVIEKLGGSGDATGNSQPMMMMQG